LTKLSDYVLAAEAAGILGVRREFRLLQALEHRGGLRAMEFTNQELGPAIIFQHHPDAIRLDHYVIQYKDQITEESQAIPPASGRVLPILSDILAKPMFPMV